MNPFYFSSFMSYFNFNLLILFIVFNLHFNKICVFDRLKICICILHTGGGWHTWCSILLLIMVLNYNVSFICIIVVFMQLVVKLSSCFLILFIPFGGILVIIMNLRVRFVVVYFSNLCCTILQNLDFVT